MPDLKLTLYYCVSWCTRIYHTAMLTVSAGIVLAYRVGHVRRITYTPKVTLTLCYSVLHDTRKTLTCAAPFASNIKC